MRNFDYWFYFLSKMQRSISTFFDSILDLNISVNNDSLTSSHIVLLDEENLCSRAATRMLQLHHAAGLSSQVRAAAVARPAAESQNSHWRTSSILLII